MLHFFHFNTFISRSQYSSDAVRRAGYKWLSATKVIAQVKFLIVWDWNGPEFHRSRNLQLKFPPFDVMSCWISIL